MQSAAFFKVLIVIALIGVIVWAVQFRKKKVEEFEQETAHRREAVIERVAEGTITPDGRTDDWAGIGAFSVEAGAQDGQAGSAGWESVALAHDGSRLHIVIKAGGAEGSAALAGQIQFDTDNSASTGERLDMAGGAVGTDAVIGIAVKSGEDEQCARYLIRIPGGSGVGMMPSRGSCEDPEYVGLQGENLEMSIPLSEVQIQSGTKVRVVLQPILAESMRGLSLRVE